MRKINTFGELYDEFADGRLFVLSGSWFDHSKRNDRKEFSAQIVNKDHLIIYYDHLYDPIPYGPHKNVMPAGGDLFLIDWIKKEMHCSCDEYRVMLGYSLTCQKRLV